MRGCVTGVLINGKEGKEQRKELAKEKVRTVINEVCHLHTVQGQELAYETVSV